MKKFVSVTQTVNQLGSIVCDVCGTEYDSENYFETQEFTHIGFTGGYGSVFGDGDKYACDICQYCLKSLLGEYLRHIDSELGRLLDIQE